MAEKTNVPEVGDTLYSTKSPPLWTKVPLSCFHPVGSSHRDIPLGPKGRSKALNCPATTSTVDVRVRLSAMRVVSVYVPGGRLTALPEVTLIGGSPALVRLTVASGGVNVILISPVAASSAASAGVTATFDPDPNLFCSRLGLKPSLRSSNTWSPGLMLEVLKLPSGCTVPAETWSISTCDPGVPPWMESDPKCGIGCRLKVSLRSSPLRIRTLCSGRSWKPSLLTLTT